MKKRFIIFLTIIIIILFNGYNTTKSMKVNPNDLHLDITTIHHYEDTELDTINVQVSWIWNERPFFTLTDAMIVTWDHELFSLVSDSYQVESYYYKDGQKILCDKNQGLANITSFGITSYFDVCKGKQITGTMTFKLNVKEQVQLEVSSYEIYAMYVHNHLGHFNARPLGHKYGNTTGKFFGQYEIIKEIEW